jgi:hypothetical protein
VQLEVRMRIRGLALVALAGLTATVYWSCGGDNENGASFSGDVSSVSSASLPVRDTRSRGLAFRLPGMPSSAHAACLAPGASARLIFCIRSGAFEVCQPVDPDSCTFGLNAVLEDDPIPLVLTFVDDANANVQRERSEDVSTVQQDLVYCNGDQVEITNAVVNFGSGTTTASISKKVDRCRNVTRTPGTPIPTRTGTPPSPTPTRTGTPPSPTPTRTGTPPSPTPTRTGTPPSPTPTRTATPPSPTPPLTPTTYSGTTSLNQSPSSMLAFLFSAGAVGLLLPRRRRRSDRHE